MTPSPAPPAETETIRQAAARYGVHPNTIRNRIAAGQLTAYRFGPKLIRLDPAEVDRLLQPCGAGAIA